MREEDKVLLFCEIMGLDTAKYVSKYIEELRSSNVFIKLCENVAKARNINSYKAQRLIDEFEMIDFYKITTLKEYFVLVAKVNFLLANSEEINYLNPFFYTSDRNSINRVGQIAINFDQKDYSIDDMILDERYTTKYKIDYIKEKYLEWRKEVYSKVIDPLKLLVVKENQIPNLNYLNTDYALLIFEVAIINFVFIFGNTIPSQFIASLYRNTCSNSLAQVVFILMFLCLVYIDVMVIIRINQLKKIFDPYRFCRKTLKKSRVIINTINRQCEKLYHYLLLGVTNKQILSESIKKYSLNQDNLYSIAYLFKITSHEIEEKESRDVFTVPLIIGFIVLIVLGTALIVIYILIKGGLF